MLKNINFGQKLKFWLKMNFFSKPWMGQGLGKISSPKIMKAK